MFSMTLLGIIYRTRINYFDISLFYSTERSKNLTMDGFPSVAVKGLAITHTHTRIRARTYTYMHTFLLLKLLRYFFLPAQFEMKSRLSGFNIRKLYAPSLRHWASSTNILSQRGIAEIGPLWSTRASMPLVVWTLRNNA